MDFLSYGISPSELVMVGIPLIFYLCGGIGKIIVRDSRHFWDRRDWYLACDASLANLAAGLLFIGEFVVEANRLGYSPHGKLLSGLTYFSGSLLLYLMILGAHQKIAPNPAGRFAQLTVLVGACNVAAIAAMVTFFIYVKGI